ncbi:MAG: L-arabinose isomerase [Brevefilum sp.]
MIDLKQLEVWFITGSQHLYGEGTLAQVAEHAQKMVDAFDSSEAIPVRVVYKPVLTTQESILNLCLDANSTENCVGLITWMHTFSPAKMWIAGLSRLRKPFVHLHTQFNREIPWAEIDMDFMNLNQSAHGDREFGFMCTRMGLNRKVVVGHWQDKTVQSSLGAWAQAACGWQDSQDLRVARFGDNMRDVAVTEGDKVEAQIQLGYSVHGFGIGDLVAYVDQVTDTEIDQLLQDYEANYHLSPEVQEDGEQRGSLREAARIEAGMRDFLEDGKFKAFTTTFENLYGLAQLPGLAVQRLMAEGYGFGAEGDWKTSALVRTMKVMSAGMPKGTSFMEDYTYHFSPSGNKVLGAHMLEVCSSIAADQPTLEILPLSIGGKADPARLIFNAYTGPAIAASLVQIDARFRLIVNEVDVTPTDAPLPKLPVARAFWSPRPALKTAAAAWIYAGGAHHTSFSYDLTYEHMEDYAEMAGIEFLLIDEHTRLSEFKKQLRWNDLYYQLSRR